MDQVRDLVRDDEPTDRRRSKDQPPAEANPSLRGAAAPAAAGVANADRRRRDASARGIFADFIRHQFERAALEEQLDPARETRLRTADAQLAVAKHGSARSA